MNKYWRNTIEFGYADNPNLRWEDRLVKVKVGKNKVSRVYEMFQESEKNKDTTYITDSLHNTLNERLNVFYTDWMESVRSVKGVCGRLEISKIEDDDVLSITFNIVT